MPPSRAHSCANIRHLRRNTIINPSTSQPLNFSAIQPRSLNCSTVSSLRSVISTVLCKSLQPISVLTITYTILSEESEPPFPPVSYKPYQGDVLRRYIPRANRHLISSYRRYFNPFLPLRSLHPNPHPRSLILTPLLSPVWIKRGLCSADSLINIALCALGFFPGLLHAWYIIAKYPEASNDYEPLPGDGGENGRVTYYYVSHGPPASQSQHGHHNQQPQHPQHQRGYGTNDGMRVEGPKKDLQARNGSDAEGQDGQGSSAAAVPPSYEQAVKGDHKVQT